MNNYTVDASVYGISDISTPDKAKAYLDNIIKLSDLVGKSHENIKNINLYFFKKDIMLLNCFNLNFTREISDKTKNMGLGKEYDRLADELLQFITQLMNRLMSQNLKKMDDLFDKDNPVYSRYKCFETWFDFDVIKTSEDSVCDPDVSKIEKNSNLAKNLQKSIFMLSFLNCFVYKNSESNKILTNYDINEDDFHTKIDIISARHSFSGIDNKPVKKQAVKNCNINNGIKRKSFAFIKDALDAAKNDFSDTLDILPEVKNSISDYYTIINKNLQNKNDKYYKITEQHIKECPNTIYDHLDALNQLVKYIKQNKNNIKLGEKPYISEKFTCRRSGTYPICYKCRGFLRLCGYECNDEWDITMTDSVAIAERTINDKPFRLHLKPYSRDKDSPLHFLTLRIHFRLSDNGEKIEIGWIGKHLYIPSKH